MSGTALSQQTLTREFSPDGVPASTPDRLAEDVVFTRLPGAAGQFLPSSLEALGGLLRRKTDLAHGLEKHLKARGLGARIHARGLSTVPFTRLGSRPTPLPTMRISKLK